MTVPEVCKKSFRKKRKFIQYYTTRISFHEKFRPTLRPESCWSFAGRRLSFVDLFYIFALYFYYTWCGGILISTKYCFMEKLQCVGRLFWGSRWFTYLQFLQEMHFYLIFIFTPTFAVWLFSLPELPHRDRSFHWQGRWKKNNLMNLFKNALHINAL